MMARQTASVVLLKILTISKLVELNNLKNMENNHHNDAGRTALIQNYMTCVPK